MSRENDKEYVVATTVKNHKRVQKRRAQIIQSAVEIFSEKGYHDTTTKEIADRARMNVGTMFQYVQSKQDILYLVCVHIHGMIESALFSVMKDEAIDPLNSLLNDISALILIIDELSDYVLIMYQETASLNEVQRRSFLQREQKLCNYFEEQIVKGIEAGIFRVNLNEVPLIAEDILVQAQMWSFRRWSLAKKYTLDTYIQSRLKMFKKQLID